jgi:ribosomal protein S18 acetylase RimI-like enzyme
MSPPAPTRYSIQLGLPPALLAEAGRLYWQAFGGKLGLVMGPEPRALAYLARAMQPDHALIAISEEGRLLGLAGFKTPRGSFAAGGPAQMRAIYGGFGAMWRGHLMGLLSQEFDDENFLLDGLCVQADLRSLGLGTALMTAIYAEARARGYPAVRLDVVDTNWRAQALYRRLGFVETKRQSIGLLRPVFGFSSAITMVRPV